MAYYEYDCMICGQDLDFDPNTHSWGHIVKSDHTPSVRYHIPGLSPPCKRIHIRTFTTDISGEVRTKYVARKPPLCSGCSQQDERCSYEIRECRVCGMVIWREKGGEWIHWHQTLTNHQFDHEATVTQMTPEMIHHYKAKFWAIARAWKTGEMTLVKALDGCKPEAFE